MYVNILVAGASLAENKNGGAKLVKAIKELPPKYTFGTYDAYELVLAKIPEHLWGEHWVADLRLALRRAKRTRGDVPWSLKGLCDEIADELKTATPSPSAHSAGHDRTKPKVTVKGDNGARAKRMKGAMLTGTLDKWSGPDESYGFISFDGDEGERVFVHKSAIIGDKPNKGDKVRFKIIAETRKGELRERADKVSRAMEENKPIVNAAAAQTEEEGGGGGDESDDDDGAPPRHYRAIVS